MDIAWRPAQLCDDSIDHAIDGPTLLGREVQAEWESESRDGSGSENGSEMHTMRAAATLGDPSMDEPSGEVAVHACCGRVGTHRVVGEPRAT